MPSRFSNLISALIVLLYVVLAAFFSALAVREHKPWDWMFTLSFLILIGSRILRARKQVEAHSR